MLDLYPQWFYFPPFTEFCGNGLVSALSPVAFFLPDLAGGGAERVSLTLSKYINEKGLRVDFVLGRASGKFIGDIPPGVRLIDLSKRWRLPTSMGLALISFFGLIFYLRRERPAVLMSSLSRANLITAMAVKFSMTGTRLVLREANTFHNIGKITLLLMKVIYPWADAIVSVSKGIANDLYTLPGLPKNKVNVIYNPVDIQKVNAMAAEAIEHPWFSPGSPPVIVGIGRLVRQKDFAMLINAFSTLRKARPVRLIILGEGDLRPALEQTIQTLGIQNDVSLPGFVGNPYAYIKRASMVAVSSQWEGMINVIIESLAIGTPVTSTDCHSGPAEILENGRYGKLVPVGDVDAFASALEDSLESPVSADLLKARAETFSVERVLPGYLDVLLNYSASCIKTEIS